MSRVLEGVKVVELAEWVFVPTCGAVLGDWGADVVKVEHPVRGDGFRGLVVQNDPVVVQAFMGVSHRNKRSVGLDIAHPDGLEILYRLVADADVFVTSFLPEARARLKVDVDDIRRHNPNVVYVRGSGWGQHGPEAGNGGFDLAATWARGGLAYKMTRSDADEPAILSGSIGDLSGGLTLAGAVAAALYRRERTGEPSVVDVSLYGMGMWLNAQWINAVGMGIEHPTMTRDEPGNALANSYRTKDNRWLWLSFIQPDRWWPDLCRHLGHPELIDDERFKDSPARAANLEECVGVLEKIFATRTLAEWTETFRTLEGVWAPASSPSEIYHDEQAIVNGYLPVVRTEGDDEAAPRVVASPAQFDDAPLESVDPVPEHGQHTEEVLLELGMSWDEILEHKVSGAVM